MIIGILSEKQKFEDIVKLLENTPLSQFRANIQRALDSGDNVDLGVMLDYLQSWLRKDDTLNFSPDFMAVVDIVERLNGLYRNDPLPPDSPGTNIAELQDSEKVIFDEIMTAMKPLFITKTPLNISQNFRRLFHRVYRERGALNPRWCADHIESALITANLARPEIFHTLIAELREIADNHNL